MERLRKYGMNHIGVIAVCFLDMWRHGGVFCFGW
jgi:hypothetical protein